MSNTIEQKVVEMRFDNKQFEKNVQTSMSTIDKLKQKLNFKGATKGLENIGNAASKVNMSGMGAAVDAMQAKFSTLEIVGITALANITNSAVNAGKRIASELTIAPVMTGFQEYETQMNAIQTILANTQSKGSTLQDVSAALDELNKYADQTIYNFTEMTRNIGTFTAAGVDLDKSVTSIKGIANLAAVSGSSSQQASTAMYQLSQALAAGKVQLMDWNSVVNAGMGGELFQNALKRTATQMGYNVDAMIEKYGSFRESLTRGEWLTADVLTETLTQLSGAYTEADLIAQGYTEAQAKEITELAQTAVDAATKVKTFSQLWDTAKEAAQSGWAQTWKLIFGDFEEAKNFFTGISGMINDFIVASGEARNKVLGDALNSKWDTFIGKINEAGVSTEAYTEQLTAVAKEHGIAIDELIKEHDSLTNVIYKGLLPTELYTEALGKFSGETTEAKTALKDANQYIVKTGDNLTAIATKYGMTWQELYKLNQDIISDPNLIYPEQILKLGEAQLKQAGYTEKQVDALKDLAKQAQETGTPINELIAQMGKPSGRQMLFASMSNAVSGFLKILSTIKSAWAAIYPPENLSNAIYSFIETLYNVSDGFIISDENAERLQRTFKGLFAALDLVTTILGGGFKFALKVTNKLLSAMGIPLLEVTATLGDAVVALHDFILENKFVDAVVDTAADGIVFLVTSVRKLVSAFLEIPAVNAGIDAFVEKIKSIKSVAENTIQGLQNGLTKGLYSIPDIMAEIGTAMLNAICNVLGIHSPSVKMEEVGTNTGLGLIKGLKGIISAIVSVAKSVGGAVVDTIGGIISAVDWGKVASIAISIGMLLVIKKMVDILEAVASPLKGLGDILSGFDNVLDETASAIKRLSKAKTLAMQAAAIKNIAIAIAILAGSVLVLSQVPAGKLFTAVGAIAALAAVIGILAAVIGKYGPTETMKFTGFTLAVIGISAALLIMANAVKKLESVDPERYSQILLGFMAMVSALALVIAVFGKFVSAEASANIAKVGAMAYGMAGAIMLMVAAIKLVGTVSSEELKAAIPFLATFMGMIVILTAISMLAGNNISKMGTMMLKLSVALMLMSVAIKMVSGLKQEDIDTAMNVLNGMTSIIFLLAVINRLGGGVSKIGGTMVAMGVAMLSMVAVIQILSGMSQEDIDKGLGAVARLSIMIGMLALIAGLAGSNGSKISLALLSMSVSIGILAGIAIVLSLIDISGLMKGLVAVGILSLFMVALVKSTEYARNMQGTLIAMTVAIAILAVAVAGLSFIDPTKLAGAVAALGIVMGMFAIVIQSTANIQNGMGVMIALTVAIGILATAIGLLSLLPVERVIGSAAALSIVLLSLAAAAKILGTIVAIPPGIISTLVVLTSAMVVLGILLGAMAALNIQPSIQTAAALSTLLLAMAGVTAILATIGPSAAAAASGGLAMAKIILILSGVIAAIVGIAGLLAQIPNADKIANDGVEMLTTFGRAIGGFIGGIIGGVAGGIIGGLSASLPMLGLSLSAFMVSLQPFLLGISTITPDMMEAMKSLASMILIITAADIIKGISSFLGLGDSSLAAFASQLAPFGEGLRAFATEVEGIKNIASVKTAAEAGKVIAEMASSLPNSGGFLAKLVGDNEMDAFAKGLKPFGEGISNFATAVDGVAFGAVNVAVDAAKKIVEVAASLPNSGGLLGSIMGENDMATFATGLAPFAEGIVTFATKVDGVEFTSVSAAIDAAKKIVDVAAGLPNSGGFLGMILGNNDLAPFAAGLKPFAEGIVAFATTVNGVEFGSVFAAIDAAKKIVDVAAELPNEGGFLSLILGDNDLSSFSSSLGKFGEGIAEYYTKISSVNAYQLSSTTSSIEKLANVAKMISETNLGSFNTFGAALKSLGNSGIDKLIEAFDGSGEKVTAAVNRFISRMNTAISDKTESVASTLTLMVSAGCLAMRTKYENFKSAGLYLVLGFCSGIINNTYRAELAAEAMAAAAAEAARRELDEHSPSKVGYEIGDFFGVAFVNAIGEYANKAYRAGRNVASQAKSGLSSALTRAGNLLDADMDMQPTIRPVLDLSSVRSGVGVLNGMLSTTPSVKTMTNLGAISMMTNRRNQNGASDIVSALNDLNKKFDNLPSGDTYSIGGVTYQDGSDVSNAIKVLIRAMKMEGRV